MTSFDFVEQASGYTGTSRGGREWRITKSLTGWRLEFRDAGDREPTYAGNHASLAAAKAEAVR